MHRGARKSLFAIVACLLAVGPAFFSVAADNPSTSEDASSDSSNALRSALHLAEDASVGLVLVPGLLDASESAPTHQAVSHMELEPSVFQDPRQLKIDDRKLLPSKSVLPFTWLGSLDWLAASRLDEEIVINGEELGTGVNGGVQARLEYRSSETGRAANAWDVVWIGLHGKESLAFDSRWVGAPEPYHYEASFGSIESNAIHRTEYKGRSREQFIGLRYIDQSDSIETTEPYFDGAVLRQETHNRMIGLQVGLHQSWSSGNRFRFSWGAKGGVFYNRGEQVGFVYEGTADTIPLLLDCHADLACRIFKEAYFGMGLVAIRLEDQYESSFAWQDPESTHRYTLLGMRLGLDYVY